jgi:RNA polymerase sigma-70 factor (ECF subfamily)
MHPINNTWLCLVVGERDTGVVRRDYCPLFFATVSTRIYVMAARPQAAFGQGYEQLLARARQGDKEALGELLQGYRGLLLKEANEGLPMELQARGGASDLVQETFLKATVAFPKFQGQEEPQFRAWLLTMLHNTERNFRRDQWTESRQPGREEPLQQGDTSSGAGQDLAAPVDSPSAAVARREEEKRLADAMAQLNEKDHTVIQLRHFQGLSFREIGEHLGISEEAARKRFTRALDQLGEVMERPPEGRPGGEVT